MIGFSPGWTGVSPWPTVGPFGLLRAMLFTLRHNRVHPHHFVAARIDNLDGGALVLTSREWQGQGARECFETVRIDHSAERLAQFLPRALVREERLRNA